MTHSPPLLLRWLHDLGSAKLENSILSALVIHSKKYMIPHLGQSWPPSISSRIIAVITNKRIFFSSAVAELRRCKMVRTACLSIKPTFFKEKLIWHWALRSIPHWTFHLSMTASSPFIFNPISVWNSICPLNNHNKFQNWERNCK